MVIDFAIQSADQLLNLVFQPFDPLATDYFGIQDRTDPLNRMVEVVVDDHVLVLLDRTQFLQR